MSRTLSTEMLEVASAELVRPIYLVKMEFDSGDLDLWSGLGNLVYGGDTYVGTGDLMAISSVRESEELTANGVTFTVSGIKDSLVQRARDEPYQGRKITLYLGAFDENADIISSPVILFSGFMDVMSISDSGETSTITIAAENKLIAFDRSSVRRFTAEDQKIDHPTDKGFEFVSKIAQQEIIWGRPTPNSTANYGGGGGFGVSFGSGCFVAGSQVLMADFTTKSIESVVIGDSVISKTGKANKVIKLHHHPMEDRWLFKVNESLEMTDSHPILTTQGWKSLNPEKTREIHPDLVIAGKLDLGDSVRKYDNIQQFYVEEVASLAKRKTLIPVFNLDVDGDDTFIVDNFVVHNK